MGTRLAEYTNSIPKPLVLIGNKPILAHIMNIYIKHGLREFIILTGYKGNLIYEYFKNKKDFKLLFHSKLKSLFTHKKLNYQISLINTGLKTSTGLRLKKIQDYFLPDENFYLTYGDGLSNINLDRLLKHHISTKSILTITAVRPPARFGEVIFKNNKVFSFEEKNNINSGWINGGFMVINSKFFSYLNKKNEMLEREPFQKCLKDKKLNAYKHYKFWQCMDNIRDKKLLEQLVKKRKVPWI